MKFSNKLSLVIFLSGVTILILSSVVLYRISYDSVLNSQLRQTETIANEVSDDIDHILQEKVKTALTLANTPLIKEGLEKSNLSYANLSGEKRNEFIKRLNGKWKSTEDPSDNFIQKFTNNKISQLLKDQQTILKGEYGEIFLTNKFGALVASTSKLSTFSHGHKYWWLGSYHDGEGAIFFDDRGYDDSVGGYVLGLVVPIRKGTEIIGILKCNLNILGSINELISGAEDKLLGEFKLARSGGMVVFEEGFEPLSTWVKDSIVRKMKSKSDKSFIINVSGEKHIVGLSEIQLSKGEQGYGFGGTFKSIDHKKGNTGESWYIIGYRQTSVVLSPVTSTVKWILLIGTLIILFLMFVSKLFGWTLAKPLLLIGTATEKIGQGVFEHRIDLKRNDEFGKLAHSFNNMADKLQRTTTSIELLQASEEKFRSFSDQSLVGIYLIQDSVLKYVNPKFAEIFGYTVEECLKDMPFQGFVHPDDIIEVEKQIQKRLSGEAKFVEYEVRCLKQDGEIIDVAVFGSSIVYNGSPAAIGTMLDITASKQAEAMLQEERASFSSILENNPHGIALTNIKGEYLYVNPMFTKITGYILPDVQTGREWFNQAYPDPEYRKTVIDAWKEDSLQEGVGRDYGFKVTCKDGQVKDIEFRTTYLKDRSISVLTDVSKRKHAEKQLQESEEKFRQLFNTAPAGIYEVDFIEGKFITVNDVMCTYSGYTTDELLSINPFDLLTENSKKQFSKRLEEIVAGEMRTSNVEYDIITKDGHELCALLTSDFIYKNGKLKGARVVAHDITERKQLEKELRYVHRMEAINTLAGGIAHQFNNALYTITGNVDLLEMDCPDDKNVAIYTQEMKASAIRMAKLTAQLLAYARGGKHQTKTIAVSTFVRETLLLVKYTIASAIDVDTDLPIDILNVRVDLPQIQMVLSAILTNSSEAIEGKGHIRIACQKIAISDDTIKDFPGLNPGDYVCLTVTDDGKGMDEESRTRIFEPFFTTKFEGRGLGMAAAYGIVKNHNGSIFVDSELEKGTTVKIYLPIVKTPIKEDAKIRQKQAGWVKGTGTILVIDDEEAVVTVCRAMLERMGYRVLAASNGQKAIDVVKTYDGGIDLAMLDIILPGMSGETIYPLLMKARPGLKVLVFSGYSENGPVQNILDAGAQGFIPKPFTMADLSQKLNKVLGSATCQ